MMKVKPFSYHIPRRKAYDNNITTAAASTSAIAFFPTSKGSSISTSSKQRNCSRSKRGGKNISTTLSHPVFLTSSSLFTLSGAGTVLVFVLLGFIGVAGQGKLSQMHSNSADSFQTQDFIPEKERISHQGINSFSKFGVLQRDNDDGDDDDDELQQRISYMGHYGTKYRNASFPYNYSSYPPPHVSNYFSGQYKLEPSFGVLRSTPRENLLLSLHEDDQHVQRIASKNRSEDVDDNVINLHTVAKLKRTQDGFNGIGDQRAMIHEHGVNFERQVPFPAITEPPTPNRTSSMKSMQNEFYNSKYQSYGSIVTKLPRQYNDAEIDDSTQEDEEEVVSINNDGREGYLKKRPLRVSPEDKHYRTTADLDDYDDVDVLEKFIPGNVSHTSGKLRFRQSSQFEVDGEENENSVRSRRRPRRSVVHLYDMVVCSTGCNPLIFKGYGCYCGFLGSGLTVDGIDKCCAKHDWCYHHAKCPPLLTYFVPYYWRCDHGRPQCVTDFRGWKGICGAHLCECDRQFAECLKKFPCPRSRAMCVTSPWSNTADPRAFPFTISRRIRPWQPPPLPPPPPGIPLLPHPSFSRIFPRFK